MEALSRRLAVARHELAELKDKFARTSSLSISISKLADQRDAVALASLKVLRLEHEVNLFACPADRVAAEASDFAAEALLHASSYRFKRLDPEV